MNFLIALISIALGSIAQFLLKLSVSGLSSEATVNLIKYVYLLKNYNFWGGLICYGLSLVLWLYVLSTMELSKAYPLVSIGYILTLFIGVFILGESVTINKFLGVAIIIIGVIILMK